jgi:signal transduction histidine kinase/ActR/RegA family two-component response regulator
VKAATLALVNGLADSKRRGEAAAALAAHLGARDFIIFIRDRTLNTLRPGPGFVQTLPGGPSWRRFLAECGSVGRHEGEVAYPTKAAMIPAYAWTSNGTIFVFLGSRPRLSEAEFQALPFALVAALLQAESEELAAAGLVATARDSSLRATTLAGALDAARAELQSKASQLETALEEAARLNAALRGLNETLELRVAGRTRDLAEANEHLRSEMAERQRAEAALLHAQRMEAVGHLTGGVAHDFNNLLTVITGNLDMLAAAVEGDDRASRFVASAQRGAERGAQLVAQLLAFARNQPLSPESVNINDLLREFQGLIARAVGETVEVAFSFDSALCACSLDPAQFQSAILNLAVNARDAMPNGGRLHIETNTVAVSAEQDRGLAELAPGEYAAVTVRDTGTGMSAEMLPRIFEPFFTTKEVGQGTGLGLSQIYGFVRQSGGTISVSSKLGEGTIFRIMLPKARASEAAATRPQPATSARGHEKILVVEDDLDVREMVLGQLDALGYEVRVARNGPEAMAMLERESRFDLLFSDVMMPDGMTGIELVAAARRRRPAIRVLLTSGQAVRLTEALRASMDGLPMLRKPYRHSELATAIRTALDRPAAGARVYVGG